MQEQTNVKHHNVNHQWHGMQISVSIMHQIVIIIIFMSPHHRATWRYVNLLFHMLANPIHLQCVQQ